MIDQVTESKFVYAIRVTGSTGAFLPRFGEFIDEVNETLRSLGFSETLVARGTVRLGTLTFSRELEPGERNGLETIVQRCIEESFPGAQCTAEIELISTETLSPGRAE